MMILPMMKKPNKILSSSNAIHLKFSMSYLCFDVEQYGAKMCMKAAITENSACPTIFQN